MTLALAEWARCRSWIDAALDHAFGYAIEDIEAAIAAGEATLWAGEKAAIVTQFWVFPKGRAVNLWLAGGDLKELVCVIRPQIERWAAALGCTHVIIAGRAGWTRALKSQGYMPAWTALSKELR